MYSMGYVFLSVTPTYWCNVPMPPGLKNLSREAQMNISIPWEKDTSGTWGYNHCKMYARNYTALSADDLHYGTSDLSVTACTDWIYDQENFGSTTVTEVGVLIPHVYVHGYGACSYLDSIYSCFRSKTERQHSALSQFPSLQGFPLIFVFGDLHMCL